MSESWDDVVASLTAAYGLKAWGTKLGHGSFLTVELGEPETAGGVHGKFHLWVYLAGWRLENATEVIAASEDDREELARKVAMLDGRILTRIIIEQPSLSARFEFDQGLVLATFSLYSAEYEHWMLYRLDGTVLTAGPGSSWSVEPASGPTGRGEA
jgi:hypothetical protein